MAAAAGRDGGALVIAAGIVTVVGLMRHVASARGSTFTPIRLSFARYLTLAFELQLAGRHPLDGSGTERIGKLAAIAVIRTALNYFLSLEMKDERAADQAALRPHPVAPDASRA